MPIAIAVVAGVLALFILVVTLAGYTPWPRWFGAWANRLDAPRPLPALADLPNVAQLDQALDATVRARETFDALGEADRVRFTLFVQHAWGRWGKSRRAAIVATQCAGGPERVAAWQEFNRAMFITYMSGKYPR